MIHDEKEPLLLLYRGPLKSCNYECSYCPFAKHRSSKQELVDDESGVARFVDWVSQHAKRPLRVLFTPRGEGLTRRWYRQALKALSQLSHVRRVAIQTNLSFVSATAWLEQTNRQRIALWASFHPEQTSLASFVERCRTLDALSVRYSVGMVGTKENIAIAKTMRAALPAHVYLWINAYKSDGPGYYTAREIDELRAIDPLFDFSQREHQSLGQRCFAGQNALTVDETGTVRRCHFVENEVLGNLYRDSLDDIATERGCPKRVCRCHIGYVHLERLGLRDVFGEGIAERIPLGPTSPQARSSR
jgi:hypothetical protein